MALTKSKNHFGIDLPNAYARICQMQLVFETPATLNVQVAVWADKAAYNADEKPLLRKSITVTTVNAPVALVNAAKALRVEFYKMVASKIEDENLDWDWSGATNDGSA